MHCMYCGRPKGTEATLLNSGKIKPVALAVIKLYLSEDYQAASQSVESSIE